MILGKKDRAYVADLEAKVKEPTICYAKELFNYLHDVEGITYHRIGKRLGFSQQYVNDIANGKKKVTNAKHYAAIANLFK